MMSHYSLKKLSRTALFSVGLIAFVGGCSDKTSNETASPAASTAPVQNTQPLATAEIANANDFALTQEPILFSLYDLGVEESIAASDIRFVLDGNPITTQAIDTDADGKHDSLFAVADFAAGEKKSLTITNDPAIKNPASKKMTQAEISIKEGGEWDGKTYVGGTFKNVDKVVPPPQYTDHSYWIRYEGPGIESDKVAYRIYLDWRNGFDIFGKKVNDVVLQDVGQDGYKNYHYHADWGVDVLKVGKTLGAGAFGYWNGKEVELISDTDSRDALITNNGDLYSSFRINYNGWKVAGKSVDIAADFGMHAGSRLVKVNAKASENIPNFAVGMVKHPNTKLIEGNRNTTGYAWTYVASWGKQSLGGEDEHLGMAVIFRAGDLIQQTTDEKSYVSVLKSYGGELEYYFLAAWELEPNGIKTEEEFVEYLDREVARLTREPRVNVTTAYSQEFTTKPLTAEIALDWAKRMSDSELDRKMYSYHAEGWDVNRRRPGKFEYDVVGVQIQAVDWLNAYAPNPRYAEIAEKISGSYITDDGQIKTFQPDLFSIDLTAPGRVILALAERTGEEKYRKAVDYLRERLKVHPRTTNGVLWHRATYPNQLWLDGVYMGMPFLAEYAAKYETGDQQHASFKEVVHEFKVTRDILRNPNTGLYFHAWDESKEAFWANKETGLSQEQWGRGMGWLAMALVDVLDFIPESETEFRQELIDMSIEFARDLVKFQDPEHGTWWQITDKANKLGNYRESSASAMFSYFLSKGVREGILDESYREVALKAYQGLLDEFTLVHRDGKMSYTNMCYVAGLGFGRDGSYDYYMQERVVKNDAKGFGPFIMASLETAKLLGAQPIQQ